MPRDFNIERTDDKLGWRDAVWLVPFFHKAVGPQARNENIRRDIHDVMSAAVALRERDHQRRAARAQASIDQAELGRVAEEIERAAASLRAAEAAPTSLPMTAVVTETNSRPRIWLVIVGLWAAIATAIVGLVAAMLSTMR